MLLVSVPARAREIPVVLIFRAKNEFKTNGFLKADREGLKFQVELKSFVKRKTKICLSLVSQELKSIKVKERRG